MDIDRDPRRNRDILFAANRPAQMIVEFDLGKGATYEILMALKGKLDAIGIQATITGGGYLLVCPQIIM